MSILRFGWLVSLLAFFSCAQYQGQLAATGALIEQQALSIAEKAVYQKAIDAGDALLKGNNVAGFGDALRSIESTAATQSISQIPSTIMDLRGIWLGPQPHYTDLAAQVSNLIVQQFKALQPATDKDKNAIIEAVIKGLQAPPPALAGP